MQNRTALTLVALAGATVLLSSCGPTAEETAELRNQQRQVLAKLDQLEKKIDTVIARGGAAPPRPAAQQSPDPDKVHQLSVGSSFVIGPTDAPVSIVEFSDYQCPFCARAEPLIQAALNEYPKKVNFVYKHFPLTSIHPQAMAAAQAAVAAGKQGKFEEMHKLLFENQRALGPEQLKEYAKRIGLDLRKFEADMNSEETQKLIREDMQLAQQVGVRGTPTIFVGGKLLQNRSVDGIKALVDQALQGKG
jgi:protein-disulfide isomerase